MAVQNLETYFAPFRDNIISRPELVYADWTATGKAYAPIETYLQKEVMPFLANTHTGSTTTGRLMSEAYAKARQIIKTHVNANEEDALLFCGSGMTAAVNKLQRLLGLRLPEWLKDDSIPENQRPIVFITHMEHHSNQASWLETIADVEIIRPGHDGGVSLPNFQALLEKHRHRLYKIAAVTACSNVTGIETPYHELAKLVHRYGGYCLVDFAASAPYINIDMHPKQDGAHLDAIYFSPHKFLGGPGSPGVLIFNQKLCKNAVPDHPGGGTIQYSNPWGEHDYIPNVEIREDGGTPPILQGIKAAMCIRLKEAMGTAQIQKREAALLQIAFDRFAAIKNIQVLVPLNQKRLGIISFTVTGAHYNLIVKLLDERFGIQTRGGCACAGTYGHQLLNVGKAQSAQIRQAIQNGNLSGKPGWVRLSLHPTMPDGELHFIMDAIAAIAANFDSWAKDYTYCAYTNEYNHYQIQATNPTNSWFQPSEWDIAGLS